jgi:hydrogenase maturation factor HypF (carbamoyltransferase family)
VGRLFDAVASLLNLCQIENRYEGEAAMQVEFAAEAEKEAIAYPFHLQAINEDEVRWAYRLEAVVAGVAGRFTPSCPGTDGGTLAASPG